MSHIWDHFNILLNLVDKIAHGLSQSLWQISVSLCTVVFCNPVAWTPHWQGNKDIRYTFVIQVESWPGSGLCELVITVSDYSLPDLLKRGHNWPIYLFMISQSIASCFYISSWISCHHLFAQQITGWLCITFIEKVMNKPGLILTKCGSTFGDLNILTFKVNNGRDRFKKDVDWCVPISLQRWAKNCLITPVNGLIAYSPNLELSSSLGAPSSSSSSFSEHCDR